MITLVCYLSAICPKPALSKSTSFRILKRRRKMFELRSSDRNIKNVRMNVQVHSLRMFQYCFMCVGVVTVIGLFAVMNS